MNTAADHASEQTAYEGVSARTAATLREAMNRLLAGRPGALGTWRARLDLRWQSRGLRGGPGCRGAGHGRMSAAGGRHRRFLEWRRRGAVPEGSGP